MLFFTSENLNLWLFIAWQTNRIAGVKIDVMLQHRLIHRFVQTSMKVQDGFWRKSLRILLIVVEVLQQFCGKVFQLERGECWCKVIFNVSSIADISRLLDFVFHVGFQPKPQPIKKSGGRGVNAFLKVDFVLFFVQLLNRLCFGFSVVGDAFRLPCFKIVACCDTDLKSAICSLSYAAFVVVSFFTFHIESLLYLFYNVVAYLIKMDYFV